MYPTNLSDSRYKVIKKELEFLKERQTLLLQKSEKDINIICYLFNHRSLFYNFYYFLGIRQFIADKNRNKYDAQHMNEMQSMMNSFKDNIGVANSLIESLKTTFDFKNEIELWRYLTNRFYFINKYIN